MQGLARVAIPALGILLVAAGVAGAVYFGGTLFANSTEGEDVAVPAAVPQAALPPIDAAAPAELETATFALG